MSLTVVQGWRDLAPGQKGACVALGAFDGVHGGHRQVIAQAAKAAQRLDAPLGVIRFSPHPARVMRPDAEPFLLMTPGQQARALEALGVERIHDIAFDADLAGLSDEDFARQVLAQGLGVRHVAAGFDITFGKGRTGDAEGLKRLGETYGFSVSIVDTVVGPDGIKVSSSAAREAVRAGDVALAARILGRPFAIEGVVVEGQHLGRKLGFPTANVELDGYVRPRLGSYATRTRLADGRLMPGVANVGENPTTGRVDARLEVWLFDFDEDLYGQTIETELVAFLRPELKFDGLDALIAQVKADADQARTLLMPPF
ncbi:MAG: bifunctional riboflavin kinase/FMN adenylyltransferase [Caulobacteraceae bacterium]|nr:bifunctional riboflavin kinase/FMN adenylyltransferase [Caulobacteraceae bacterium]